MTILYKQHFRGGAVVLASGKVGERDRVQQKISGSACFDPEL